MSKQLNYQLDYCYLSKNEKKIYNETTLLLVLKGQMALTYCNQPYILGPGDLIVANVNETVDKILQQTEPTIYLELAINNLFFASQFPAFFHTRFSCLPQTSYQENSDMVLLRKQVSELCLIDFGSDPSKTIKLTLSLCQIILTLTQFFKSQDHSAHFSDNHKLKDVLLFIEENYQNNLDLQTVAKTFYMSEPALSKFFKAETGHFFSEYLRLIQIRHSLNELLYTKKSIEDIALDNGFKTSKTFRQQFKKIMNQSPTSYREAHQKQKVLLHSQLIETDSDTKLKTILVALYRYADVATVEELAIPFTPAQEMLQIQVTEETLPLKKSTTIINVGCLENLASAKLQAEIRMLKKEASIHAIGIDSLLKNLPMSVEIYQEVHMNAFPQFEPLEQIIAFLAEMDLDIFYTLSLKAFNKISSKRRSYLQRFIQHLKKTIRKEKWPQLFIACQLDLPDFETNLQHFNNVQSKLRHLMPTSRIGAEIPLRDPFDQETQPDLLEKFYQNIASKCDLLTYQAEPNHVFFKASDDFQDQKQHQHYVIDKTLSIKRAMKNYGIHCPIYLTDWNTLTGMTRRANGLFFRGAIILNEILTLNHLVDGYGFWLNIELFEQHTNKKSLKTDGLEIFHYFSGKRPTYFSLVLAERLHGQIVAQDHNYILTVANGCYQLLVWNMTYFNPDLSSEELFLASHGATYSVTLTGFPKHDFQVKQLDFNRHNGALFYSYDKVADVPYIDFETQEYINQTTQLQLKNYRMNSLSDLHFQLTLDANAVTLLEFTPLA